MSFARIPLIPGSRVVIKVAKDLEPGWNNVNVRITKVGQSDKQIFPLLNIRGLQSGQVYRVSMTGIRDVPLVPGREVVLNVGKRFASDGTDVSVYVMDEAKVCTIASPDLRRDESDDSRIRVMNVASTSNLGPEQRCRILESPARDAPINTHRHFGMPLPRFDVSTSTPPPRAFSPPKALQSLFAKYAPDFQWDEFMKGDGAAVFQKAMDRAIWSNLPDKNSEPHETYEAIIKDAAANKELLDQFVAIAVATDDCATHTDRAQYVAGQVAIAWVAHSIRSGAFDHRPEKAVNLIMQVLRHEVLGEQAALIAQRIAESEGREAIWGAPVYQALLHGLKEEFELIVVGKTFSPVGDVLTKTADLERAREALKVLDDDKSARLWKSELWNAWLQRQYPAGFDEAPGRIEARSGYTDAA